MLRAAAPPLVAAFLLLSACGSPFSQTPPVTDSTFVSVLAELHLAEARLGDDEARPRPDTALVALPPAIRDSVLARHGLGYRAFRRALTYYIERPDAYAEVYARVVDTLSAEREMLRADEERRGAPPESFPAPEAFHD